MDSFSPFKADDTTTLNSMKLMSPIESCYRSPLRDTTNCVLPLEVGGSKKSDPVGTHQLPGEKREFTEENDFPQHQQSTPVKHLDCDTESDTTAEYESAGEASPWEKPSNVSALADYLAGVHLSTPDKIHTELNYFPFSPISAEDECDDEVTAIISNASQSSSHTLSFHEREEISIIKQDKTVSNVGNTSFSDVDPEEFKNSVPCKRHSETNITLQFSDEAFGRGGADFETEMSCSIEENKLKTPPPSLNESEEITSTVLATVEKLCDSVNFKITTSETISPIRNATLNLSSSESNAVDSVPSFADNERKFVEQSCSATYLSPTNKSPVPVFLEKDATSLDSLEDGVTIISEVESSSSNVSQTSHANDYVSTTKHKIDTIFSSNKEIVSNVICETKQQIDNMFKRKSPIKELASNVSHVIDSIKNLNTSESDTSPQKNVLIEKISSPILSAKQKIDSLFSPKKTVMDKKIFEKTSVSEVSVVNEICEKKFKEDNNETNQNNSSFNTVIVEHLNVDTSVSGLSVIPLKTSSESHEVIETSKQQIDKIFKSLSPPKVTTPSEVLELSNSTVSTDVELEDEICIISPLSSESGFEQTSSKQSSKTEFSVDESIRSSNNVIASDTKKTEIDQLTISSSKEESVLSLVVNEMDKSTVLENLNETCQISEVTQSVDLKSGVEENASSDLVPNRHLIGNTSDEVLNKTTTDEVSDATPREDIVVQGGDERSGHNVDEQGSISQNSLKFDEQHLSDYQSTFEVFKKDVLDASRTFHIISPKKESFNISLSTILDQKEELTSSESTTEPPTNIAANDSVITNVSENNHQINNSSIDKINSQLETLSIAPNLDESFLNMEHEESVVSGSQNIGPVNISSLELSEVLDVKIIGANDSMPVFPLESKENLNLQVSPENVDSSDLDPKEIDDVAELHSTITEEVIDNKIICEGSNDSNDSHLETLSIAPNLDESVLNMEHEESVVSGSQNVGHVNISSLELSKVIDVKIIGLESKENFNLRVSPENVDCSDLDPKEIDDVAELQSTITEEVIDSKIISEDPNDSYDCHSDLKPPQEALDVNAVDQVTFIKEVEDFVVVDVAELEKDVSVPISPKKFSPCFEQNDGIDISHVSVKFDGDKKVDEAKRNVECTVSVSTSVETVENQIQMEFPSPRKELMKGNVELIETEVKITDVNKQVSAEHIEKNDVEPVVYISECDSVADVIDIHENVKSSSLVVSSVEVENDMSNTVSGGDQLNSQSQEVVSTNVELEKKGEPMSNIIENNLTADSIVEKEVIGVSVHTEEKFADMKVTEIIESFSIMNKDIDFKKEIDDSVFAQNDSKQRQSNSVNLHTSGGCNMDIALEKTTIDSDINTSKNDEHANVSLNTILQAPIKENSIKKIHDFQFKEIQSEIKQGETYPEDSARLEEEKCTVSEIISKQQMEQCSPKIPIEEEQVILKQAYSSSNETFVKNVIIDNAVVNESVVGCSNEVNKPSTNEKRKSPQRTDVTDDLFNEIFQHGKDQMCKVTTKYSENKQSKSEVSVTLEEPHQIVEQNSNTTSLVTKSTGNDSEFFKNAGFSSELVLSDKVKSPPFACLVSSDSIAFGSPSEYSLSLSPIDSFTAGTKCDLSKSSPNDISAGNSTSTVSCNKTYSSSAEIGMGFKSSSESLEIIKSDLSKQNNELSPSLQTTLQIQGEMSTRNEKYSYTYNKNSKDFRGSPASKNSEKEYSSLCDNFKTFKLDDLSKSTIERKSYEDLLDRCLEQERLLGFDETIKEEADKLIKEIANASSDDICVQPDEFPPANANNSEAGPVTADEDLNKADLFQDAALFDFDYLSKIGKGKPSRRLARESLFLKFDPLAAAAAAVATPEPAQEMAQADSSSDVISTPPRAPLLHNGDDKLVSITPCDEATCSPASSTVATPPRSKARTSSCSATPTLRHEILSKEISKLQDLMMRQESSYQEQIAARTEEVEQLREQLAELEARDNQADIQGKLAATEAEAAKLRKEVAEAAESKKQLMMIMEEYEKTISQVVTMREDDKKKFEMEKEQISMEREGALVHLRNMEIAFNDVHQKYEKCKEVIEAFKHNEEQYKISLNENRKTIIQQEENYRKLKEHAAQKLEQANIEITEMKKAHQAEIAKMFAVQRKMEIRVKSLEESLEQKKREAAELTKICDDLITKVEQ